MMNSVQLVGSAAAFLSAVMFLPQVLKTWRTRSADGLAWGTLLTSTSCLTLWLIYGCCLHDLPMMLGNTVSVSFTLTLMIFKITFRPKPALG